MNRFTSVVVLSSLLVLTGCSTNLPVSTHVKMWLLDQGFIDPPPLPKNNPFRTIAPAQYLPAPPKPNLNCDNQLKQFGPNGKENWSKEPAETRYYPEVDMSPMWLRVYKTPAPKAYCK